MATERIGYRGDRACLPEIYMGRCISVGGVMLPLRRLQGTFQMLKLIVSAG
jgi:hypothetical protein